MGIRIAVAHLDFFLVKFFTFLPDALCVLFVCKSLVKYIDKQPSDHFRFSFFLNILNIKLTRLLHMKKYIGDEGARNYARSFYSGNTWRKKSEAYRKKHPFCERCLSRGIIEPASCVHHKIHINKNNYRDYKILLNSSNLESLCMNCHAREHSSEKIEFEFEENGMLKLNYEKE